MLGSLLRAGVPRHMHGSLRFSRPLHSAILEHVETLAQRYTQLQTELETSFSANTMKEVSRLQPIIEAHKSLTGTMEEMKELQELLSESKEDQEIDSHL